MKATDHVTRACPEGQPPQPPVDAVRVLLSQTAYGLLCKDNVFPTLRFDKRVKSRGAQGEHWITQQQALDLLRYAKVSLAHQFGGVKNSLHGLIRSLELEIDEARFRRKWLEDESPRALRHEGRLIEYIATPRQLKHLGAPEDLQLPGRPNGPSKRSTFIGVGGKRFTVLRGDHIWPGTYLTRELDQPREGDAASDSQLIKLLKAPQTANAFRRQKVEALSMAARVFAVVVDTKSPGYDFAPETLEKYVQEVELSARRLAAILMAGSVIGTGPGKLIAERQAELAKQDRHLQGFLKMVRASTKGAV